MGELIKICAWCKVDLDKLRNKDREFVEGDDSISHGLCKKCAKEHFGYSDEELQEMFGDIDEDENFLNKKSLSSYAGFIEDLIKKLTKDRVTHHQRRGFEKIPGVDVNKAYQIFSKIESNNSFAVGDSGTSFGKTQVQIGSFLRKISDIPDVENITGLSPFEMKSFADEWEKQKKILSNTNWRKKVSVDKNEVFKFVKNNPKRSMKRREGIVVRVFPGGQPGVIRIINNDVYAEVLDLDVLRGLGLDTSSQGVMQKVRSIMSRFITWAVVRNALARILAYQKMPNTHDKIMSVFSSKNVNNNPELLSITDSVVQSDFVNRVQSVVDAVNKYEYNTNAPGAYNIYQLIGISNAGGVGAVVNFLKNQKPFSPGYLTYLNKGNTEIQKITGMPTQMPPDGGLSGFTTMANLKNFIMKKSSLVGDNFLSFPDQYIDDIKSGKRKITIRVEDVPFKVSDIIKCMSYSGAHVCDLRINAKNLMSVNRIRKAYGKKMADALEEKFGPKGQFTVIRFEPWSVSFAKDVESNAYDYGILNINDTGEPFGESGAIYPSSNISNDESYSYAMKKLNNIWKIADSVGRGSAEERKKKEQEAVRKFLQDYGDEFGDESELKEELIPGKKTKRKIKKEPDSFGELISKPGIVSLFDDEKLQKEEKEKIKKNREEKPPNSPWYEKEDLKEMRPIKKLDLPKKPVNLKPRVVDFEKIEKEDFDLENIKSESDFVEEQIGIKEDDFIILTPSQICDVEGDWVISCEEVYKNRHLYDEISIDDIFKKHKIVESDVLPELLNVEENEVVYKEPSVSKETLEEEVEEPELTNYEIEKIQENINPNSDNIVQRLPKDTNPDAIRLIDSNPSIALDPTDEQYIDDDVIVDSGLLEDDDFDLDKIMEETISEVETKKQLRYGGDLLITPFKVIKSSDGYEKHINLDEWPQKIDSVEKMKEKGVSGEVVSYFTPEALFSGKKMRELFLEDKSWEILKKHPSSVQTYILPYLIDSLGKAWFNNNKEKSTFDNSPFGLWGVGEEAKNFVSLLLKEGISFEDSFNGKVIISKINEIVTKYANNYFSMFTSTLPIDKYIYSYLDKDMRRWVADMHGFKEKKLIICSVCRKERFENGIDAAMKRELSVEAEPEFGKMVKLYGKSKVGLWECANCKNRVENVSYETNIIDEKIKQIKNKILDIKSESMDYGLDELPVLNIELKDLEESKLHLEQSKNKYVNQLRIPRMHTWCPNEECPGQRIPLTSIDWSDDFWQTKESKEVSLKLNLQYGIEIPKHVGLQPKIQNDDDYIYKDTNKHKHIPDSWMLNIPFICPHDGIKFTLESAKNKGAFGKGGHLWDPWQKSIWKPIGDAMKTSFEDSGIDIEEKNTVEEALDNYRISELARKILIIKYWDERHSFLLSTSEKYNSFESALKNKSIMGKFRNLALYDSILNFSSYDNLAYTGWLCNKEIIKKQEMLGNNVGETRKLDKNIKETRREDVFVPVLQKWIDVMLSRGKSWREGFDQYSLSSWLVDEKKHGIKSKWLDTVGTFFVSKVKKGRFEFKLQDKFDKSKESKDLRLVKILNVFKIKEDRLGDLTSEELNGTSDIKEEEKINSIVEDFTENLSSLVINYNFSGGNIETNSSIVSGDYILIHGLVISGKYDHPAITAIREVRSDNDDKKLFEQLGQLIVNDIDNPKIWNEVKRLSSLKEKMLEGDFKNQLESLRKKVEEEIKFRKEDEEVAENDLNLLEVSSSYKQFNKLSKDFLKEYKEKRDFKETSEPEGKVETKNKYRFVIQSHHAEKAKHHFDLRLENNNGVLQSWSIPKHKMPKEDEKLLAIQTEDHPIDYLDFQGEINKGYGKGTVEILFSGNYIPIEFTDDKIVFEIKSKKINGTYALIKTYGNRWIFLKKNINKGE